MAVQQYTLSIGGTPQPIRKGSLRIINAVERRSEGRFIVYDLAGTQHFTRGQPVALKDGNGVLAYGGTVTSSKERAEADQPDNATLATLTHDVTCADWHTLADKRRFGYTNTNVPAGTIIGDMLSQVLIAEGVYGVRNLLSANQANVETNTTGFTAINGATLTRDTTQFWQGAASLKVVTPGSGAGEGMAALLASTSYLSGGVYTVSAFVKGTFGQTLRFFAYQLSPSIAIGPVTTFVCTGGWQRVTATATLPNPLLATSYGLRVDTSGTLATTFFVDGLQIEPDWASAVNYPVTNLYSAFQSDFEGASPSFPDPNFKVGGNVTISQDGTTPQHGTSALKVITAGLGTFESVSVNLPISSYVLGATYTFSLWARALSGTPTLRIFCEGNDLIAGNASIGTVSSYTLSTSWQRITFQVTMPGSWGVFTYVGIRIDTGGVAQALTFWIDGLQVEAGNAASDWVLGGPTQYQPGSPWEVGGTSTVQAGPTIQSFISNYETCAAGLDALAQAAGFYWQIDERKRLWFAAPATIFAPFALDGTVTDRDSLRVENVQPLYRNRQYLLGGTDTTTTQVETRIGDGTATAFTMSFALAQTPTVEVKIGAGSFTTKTVGIGGVSTGKDWYWNADKNVVFQDTAGVKLTSADTLRVTYIGSFPVVVLSSDAAAIAAEQALEGGPGAGTGQIDDAVVDSTISSSAVGFQQASALLAKYGVPGKIITFATLTPGLKQGQLATVNLIQHGITSEQALIEEVSIGDDDGVNIWYTIKAVEGPVDSTWIAFFAGLGQRKSGQNIINLGSATLLALLQPTSETWTWTENVVEAVQACLICNTTTICNTTAIVC